MKSLVRLYGHILQDSGIRCAVDPTLDIRTIERRYEHEGLGFLTITLPAFGQALDRALADGKLTTPSAFSANGGLPRFLGGFLRLVFDNTGSLREDASHEAILCLRQVLYLAKKVRLQCSDRRRRAAVDAYSACEDDLAQVQVDSEEYRMTVEVGRIIFASLLIDSPYGDITPHLVGRHGPGSTAERILGNSKYRHKRWHRRLTDAGLDYERFGVVSPLNIGLDDTPEPEQIAPCDEEPVRVIFVPKTMKTPRVIAIEPVCMQFMQQAILNWLVPRVERCRFTRGRVNFTSQEYNQTACKEASINGNQATLDLKDASDRVTWSMVESMLRPYPHLCGLVGACRSQLARLPNGNTVRLRKFASMGSALCFPFEAIAFFSAIVASRIHRAGRPVRADHVSRFARGILVFGDDLIVRTREAADVTAWLETIGFRVNANKSFATGKFRESCGVDYFAGTRVDPAYLRELPTGDIRNAQALASTVSLGNHLYERGFWGAAREIRRMVDGGVRRVLRGPLPHVRRDSASLGWYSYSNMSTYQRWNPELFRFEFQGIGIQQRYKADPLTGDPALFKSLSSIPISKGKLDHLFPSGKDDKGLERYVVPGATTLKRRWFAY